ncbi:unnamed protein product [Protopolystoma xenopodis]|uniref:Uncharacterized protein n=1 Tax=Protopolystoma xenopodis TaxID=117903 RepID=A0A3S4ZX58_9PLAT|nr:unnamed protein product [Protopolystoma xenopodis]
MLPVSLAASLLPNWLWRLASEAWWARAIRRLDKTRRLAAKQSPFRQTSSNTTSRIMSNAPQRLISSCRTLDGISEISGTDDGGSQDNQAFEGKLELDPSSYRQLTSLIPTDGSRAFQRVSYLRRPSSPSTEHTIVTSPTVISPSCQQSAELHPPVWVHHHSEIDLCELEKSCEPEVDPQKCSSMLFEKPNSPL